MAGRGKPQQKIVVACAAHDEAIEIMQPEMRAQYERELGRIRPQSDDQAGPPNPGAA